MTTVRNVLNKLVRDEDGGELLEYALIAGLIVIAAIAAIKIFSEALQTKFSDMADEVTTSGS